VVLSVDAGARIVASDLALHIREEAGQASHWWAPLRDIVRHVETAAIAERLRDHGYNRTATAASLGITREGLWHKLRHLGLAIPRRQPDGQDGS